MKKKREGKNNNQNQNPTKTNIAKKTNKQTKNLPQDKKGITSYT